MKEIIWTTEKRKVNDLIPYEHNPRQMNELQVKQLTASLQKFGLAEIPAINKDDTIAAGHQRVKILQLLGRGEEIIDVRMPNRQLTLIELQEYNLRSNFNKGDFDTDMLVAFDDDLLKAVGFTKPDLGIYEDDDGDGDSTSIGYTIDCPHCSKKVKVSNRVKTVSKFEEEDISGHKAE